MSKIKIEDIIEYDGAWHKGDKDGNCEQFTMVDLKELLSQQKEEIKKVVKKDLDNGMFNKICSNETTFMDYLSNLLEKL